MYELRSLWLPIFRSVTVTVLVLLLAAPSTAPLMAQVSSGDTPATPSYDSGTGVTDADDEEEDIDEWENDILKRTDPLLSVGWILEVVAPWIDAVGGFLGGSAHSGTTNR